jgi:hypothetical protein
MLEHLEFYKKYTSVVLDNITIDIESQGFTKVEQK